MSEATKHSADIKGSSTIAGQVHEEVLTTDAKVNVEVGRSPNLPKNVLLVRIADVYRSRLEAALRKAGAPSVEVAVDESAAERTLKREGYRLGAIVIDPSAHPRETTAWMFRIRQEFPWIPFVLHANMSSSGFLAELDGVSRGRLEHYYKIEPGTASYENEAIELLATTQSWIERRFSGRIPFSAGDTRPLTEAGGLLISVSHTSRAWELEGDAFVLPLGSAYESGGLAQALFDLPDGKQLQKALAEVSKDRKTLAPAEPVAVPAWPLTWLENEALKRPIILATAGTRASRASASAYEVAAAACVACCNLAERQFGARTLVLPVIGAGAAGLSAATVVQVFVDQLAGARFRALRHVVIAVQENADFVELLKRFREEEPEANPRCQPLLNDVPVGPDQLNIQHEVDALADAIALVETKPPLVVGVLGGWGSGKSFVLHLLEERLRRIRGENLDRWDQGAFPYVGHLYRVKFDAWTYAKANLWASLTHQIFTDLDRQLKVERILASASVDARSTTSLWRVVDRLEQNRLQELEGELGQKVLERLQSLARGQTEETADDRATAAGLWGELEKLREEELALLRTAKERLNDRSKETAKRSKELRTRNAIALRRIRRRHADKRRQAEGAEVEAIEKLRTKRATDEAKARDALERDVEQHLRDVEARETAFRSDVEARNRSADRLAREEQNERHAAATARERTARATAVKALLKGQSWPFQWSLAKILGREDLQKGRTVVSENLLRGELGTWSRLIGGLNGWSVLLLFLGGAALYWGPSLVASLQALGAHLRGLAETSGVTTLVLALFGFWNKGGKRLVDATVRYQQDVRRLREEEAQAHQEQLDEIANRYAKDRDALAEKGTASAREYHERRVTDGKRLHERREAYAQTLRDLMATFEGEVASTRSDYRSHIAALQSKQIQREERLQAIADLRVMKLEEQHERELAHLRAEIAERERRAGITAQVESVGDLVRRRLAEGGYENHLGLVHQVQDDLRELSEALDRGDDKAFPRGARRVVLFVDDLDRCPPDDVVAVLEAAQLLVKTNLFVVVLAMDMRYITRALEKQYDGILVQGGCPSGLDYVEKIIQIPYRVRGIPEAAMRGYVQSQVPVLGATPVPIQEQAEPRDEGRKATESGIEPKQDLPFRAVSEPERTLRPLPSDVRALGSEELEMVAQCCSAVAIGPRAVKRLANVFKILKITWYRGPAHEEPSEPAKQAVILLLAMSAAHANLMRGVLRELEERFRSGNTSGTLQKLLDERLLPATLPGTPDWAIVERLRAAVQNERLLSPTLTISAFTESNMNLVTSFCFVGEVSSGPEAAPPNPVTLAPPQESTAPPGEAQAS